MPGFTRDRLTWTAYVVLGWFAYLQAAPGLVVPHLRSELELSYSTGGLFVTAFAAGSTVAGTLSGRLERSLGRRNLLWAAATVLGLGTVGLAAGGTAGLTLGAVLVMGLGGGLVLATIQAVLSDHHGDLRSVALTEVNVAASCGYLLLVAMLSLAAQLGAGWRVVLVGSLVIPVVMWWQSRSQPIEDPAPVHDAGGRRLPSAFWVVAAIVACATAVEWSVTAWGATFVQETTRVSADAAVALMGVYFGGFLLGRVLGSRLARRMEPARLLGWALGLTAVGFAIVWTSTEPLQAGPGLVLLGAGIGNLFPMVVSAAVAVAPDQAGQVSGRVVVASAGAIVLAPVTVGALADATSLRAALMVVPVLLAISAAGLVLLRHVTRRAVSGQRLGDQSDLLG
jgi:MFS family permease